MVIRRLRVQAADALLVKAIVEAHEGVASVFGEEGGALTLAAPESREAELDLLLADLGELLSAKD
jgi:hypothetical protein